MIDDSSNNKGNNVTNQQNITEMNGNCNVVNYNMMYDNSSDATDELDEEARKKLKKKRDKKKGSKKKTKKRRRDE